MLPYKVLIHCPSCISYRPGWIGLGRHCPDCRHGSIEVSREYAAATGYAHDEFCCCVDCLSRANTPQPVKS